MTKTRPLKTRTIPLERRLEEKLNDFFIADPPEGLMPTKSFGATLALYRTAIEIGLVEDFRKVFGPVSSHLLAFSLHCALKSPDPTLFEFTVIQNWIPDVEALPGHEIERFIRPTPPEMDAFHELRRARGDGPYLKRRDFFELRESLENPVMPGDEKEAVMEDRIREAAWYYGHEGTGPFSGILLASEAAGLMRIRILEKLRASKSVRDDDPELPLMGVQAGNSSVITVLGTLERLSIFQDPDTDVWRVPRIPESFAGWVESFLLGDEDMF